MKYCECLNCGEFVEITGASKDTLGWHTACPKCGGSFDIDIENYVLPAGTLVKLPSGEKGVVSDFRDECAKEMDDILYLVTYRIGTEEYTVRARHGTLTVIEDWRKTRRTKYGIVRVCHYPKNQDWSNVPCYNCPDRTRCNADIYERLAQYEDTGLMPDVVAEYKKFEDELVRNDLTLQQILDLIKAKQEGVLVVLPAKEVYELTWDAGPGCDLRCPESVDGQGCCNLCKHGELFAYLRECRQEHIDRIGKDVFLDKLDAELAIEAIRAEEKGETE